MKRAIRRDWLGRSTAAILAVTLSVVSRAAEETALVKSPVAPRDSLQHLVVSPELKVELVACEPQIVDPVEVRFDEAGRMWVVEMRDYPTGRTGGNPNASRI